MVSMLVGTEMWGTMRVEALFEFAVTRRMPWGDDIDSLLSHVEAVQARLAEQSQVIDPYFTTDIDSGRVFVRFTVAASGKAGAEADARTVLGDVIRDAAAYHDGLFPHQAEYKMVPRLKSWSGLRTPTWQVRRTRFTVEIPDEAAGW
jgi:hypothetical protein